jgi:hypothetical protein
MDQKWGSPACVEMINIIHPVEISHVLLLRLPFSLMKNLSHG